MRCVIVSTLRTSGLLFPFVSMAAYAAEATLTLPATATAPTVGDAMTAEGLVKLVFTTGVVSALGGAVLNQGIAWFRDHRKDVKVAKGEATYGALRLAVVLETYAITCADYIGDNNLHDSSGGHAGVPHSGLPKLDYPDDIPWKVINPALSSRLLSLPNEIYLAKGAIDFEHQISEPYDNTVLTQFNHQAGKTGYRAWLLAADLRKQYALPKFDPVQFSWDVVATLRSNHDEAMERVREHNAEADPAQT